MRSACLLLSGFMVMACWSRATPLQPVSSYLVTDSPIDIGVGSGGFCIAVNPTDPQGVWWWQPGASGCRSRSTGPGVFHAEEAKVSTSSRAGALDVRFRVQLIPGPGSSAPAFKDVMLTLDGVNMTALATGAQVTRSRQNDLAVPESSR